MTYECPDCGRHVYCSVHICDADVPDAMDLAAVLFDEDGLQVPEDDPRFDQTPGGMV